MQKKHEILSMILLFLQLSEAKFHRHVETLPDGDLRVTVVEQFTSHVNAAVFVVAEQLHVDPFTFEHHGHGFVAHEVSSRYAGSNEAGSSAANHRHARLSKRPNETRIDEQTIVRIARVARRVGLSIVEDVCIVALR